MANDFIYVFFKVGDCGPSIKQKDGMPIAYIDPAEWEDKNIAPGRMDHRAYACCRVPKVHKQLFVDACKPNIPGIPRKNDPAYRAASKLITFSELQQATGISNLESDLREFGKSVSVINGMALPWESLFKTSAQLNPVAKDNNQVNQGTYDIGVAGDYALFSLAFADIAGAGLAGTLGFRQKSAVTETAIVKITESLNGNDFNFYSAINPLGVPGEGYLMQDNVANVCFYITPVGPGVVNCYNIMARRVAAFIAGLGIFHSDAVGVGEDFIYNIYECLIDGNGMKAAYGMFLNDAQITSYINNVLVWECATANIGLSVSASSIIENCTSFNAGTNGIDLMGGSNRCLSCSSFNAAGACFANIAAETGSNNAASDGSNLDVMWGVGTNNYANQVAITEFESVNDADANFMKVTNNGVCGRNGLAHLIARNTYGIRGNARPTYDQSYSIGADQWQSSVPSMPLQSRISNRIGIGIH